MAIAGTGVQLGAIDGIAGAMLTPGKHIPEGQLWTGRPAAFRRDLADEERAAMAEQTQHYVDNARRHRQALGAAAP